MYNSSSYFTEGRILIGQNDELIDAGLCVEGEEPRNGWGSMPNIPAHLSILSPTPTILLHQTTGDTTAPTIMMTSKDPGNITAFGPNGTENAATWISNRDGEILNIEMTTTYMTAPVFDPESQSSAENRFHAANRAHVWSLDYYYDTVTDEIEYCYMRLGAASATSTSAGSHYLPVSDTGDPPVGMRAGGFWLDTSEANGSETNPTVRCTLLGNV